MRLGLVKIGWFDWIHSFLAHPISHIRTSAEPSACGTCSAVALSALAVDALALAALTLTALALIALAVVAVALSALALSALAVCV